MLRETNDLGPKQDARSRSMLEGCGVKTSISLVGMTGLCCLPPPPSALTKGASRKSFCSILGTISSMRMPISCLGFALWRHASLPSYDLWKTPETRSKSVPAFFENWAVSMATSTRPAREFGLKCLHQLRRPFQGQLRLAHNGPEEPKFILATSKLYPDGLNVF